MTIYSQSESAGPVELCAVILSGTLAVAIPAINIGLVDGSAVAGTVFLLLSSYDFMYKKEYLKNIYILI